MHWWAHQHKKSLTSTENNSGEWLNNWRILSMLRDVHSPGGKRVTVKVYNQEKTSREQIQRVHHKEKTRPEKKKHLKKPEHFWKSILWTAGIKINMHQNDGKKKCEWKRLGTAHDPYNIICETWWRQCDAWACMASSGTGLLVFSGDVTEDRSSRMNFEVYRDILSAQIQPNAAKLIGWCFLAQIDDDPKHPAKATQEFLKVMKWNILQWPSQSPDLKPIEHEFHLLKTKLKAARPTNKQQLKSAAVKAWHSITKEETQSSRLKAVIAWILNKI